MYSKKSWQEKTADKKGLPKILRLQKNFHFLMLLQKREPERWIDVSWLILKKEKRGVTSLSGLYDLITLTLSSGNFSKIIIGL